MSYSTSQYILPPVHRVADETLSEIFLLCIPDYKFTSEPIRPNQKLDGYYRAVLLPGSVCSHWRNVATILTPDLWTYLRVPLDREPMDIDAEMTKLWLSRSGHRPLKLQLDYWLGNAWGPTITLPDVLLALVDTIVEHAERWQALAISLLVLQSSVISSVSGRLNRLRDLFITGFHVQHIIDVDLFRNSPQLRSLTLGRSCSSRPLKLGMPWSLLTNFDMGLVRLGECYNLLVQAPNLVKCRCSIRTRDRAESFSGVILRPHLEELELEITYPIGALLNAFSFPALRRFIFYEEAEHWPQDEFIALMSRSHPPLVELSLAFASKEDITEDELLTCLELFPGLETLCLDYLAMRLSTTALRRMTRPTSLSEDNICSPYLLPRLQVLKVDPRDVDEADALRFMDMVDSRLKNAQSSSETHPVLDALTLSLSDVGEFPWGLPAQNRLRQCAQQGLNLIQKVWKQEVGREINIPLSMDDINN